ncbi:MAG TPA: hypothetical protein PKD92_03530 [Novosphingobium sp.]|nr:hypothetical protein [Novosphingobium sp.]HMP55625.1 hypothetical protein [Novosphingobium sp.]
MKSLSASSVQIAVAGLVLAASLVMPRAGAATLLVPLGRADGLGAGLAERTGDIALVAAGRLPGSIVIRSSDGAETWRWIRHGILPLAVPLPACGER